MKLKNVIIEEYESAFPADKEFTDWVNAVDYEYNEADNVPALVLTDKATVVLHKDNTADRGYYVGLDRV